MIMRKPILSLIIAIIFMSASSQDVEKIYLFDSWQITETEGYHLINFEKTLLHGIAGEPTLPYQDVALFLKPGEIADSIELIFENEVILSRQYQLYPAQYSIPMSYEGNHPFIKNALLYNTDQVYPTNPKGHLTTAFMSGIGVALCSFTPVRFNPVSGEVSYYKKVTAKIYSSINNQQSTITNQQSLTISQGKSNTYQLLIVTSPAFENRFQRRLYTFDQRPPARRQYHMARRVELHSGTFSV